MRVLGINAVYHDPAAALVVDGALVAAAEEERFSRRKHGKRPVPFSAWELPELAARVVPGRGGPARRRSSTRSPTPSTRQLHLPPERARAARPVGRAARPPTPSRPATSCADGAARRGPGHGCATSRTTSRTPPPPALAAPFDGDCAVLVLDGRGERHSHLAGRLPRRPARGAALAAAAALARACSTRTRREHLGFLRSSRRVQGDGAGLLRHAAATPRRCASWCTPPATAASPRRRRRLGVAGQAARARRATWTAGPRRPGGEPAAASWRRPCSTSPAGCTSAPASAGWRSPAASRSTAWPTPGIARRDGVRARCGCSRPPATPAPRWAARCTLAAEAATGRSRRWPTAALGRGFTDEQIEAALQHRPGALRAARRRGGGGRPRALAEDGVVAWFQGRSEFGPRALGHRSLLAHPGRAENLARLNDVKGREQFRPVAPMVRAERAAEIFARGPLPSPVHAVRPRRAPSVARRASRPSSTSTAPPGSRPSTAADEPLVARHARRRSSGAPACPWSSTPASTPPAGRWSTTSATRSSASARPRSTCSRSARSPCGGPGAWAARERPGTPSSCRRSGARRWRRLLDSLDRAAGPATGDRRVADDRPGAPAPLRRPQQLRRHPVTVLRCGGRGPAAARNAGWRLLDTDWVAFLDDDVLVGRGLAARARRRPRRRRPDVGRRARAASTCRCPADRRPDRLGAGHRRAGRRRAGSPPTWPTGAPRCSASAASTSASRARSARTPTWHCGCRPPGRRLATGSRHTRHPVRPAPWYASAAQQRGNADDALMRRLHGPDWHTRAEAPASGAARSTWSPPPPRCSAPSPPSRAAAVSPRSARPPGRG